MKKPEENKGRESERQGYDIGLAPIKERDQGGVLNMLKSFRCAGEQYWDRRQSCLSQECVYLPMAAKLSCWPMRSVAYM